jgi:hypothetical protein
MFIDIGKASPYVYIHSSQATQENAMYLPCKNCGSHFETRTTRAKDSRYCTHFCETQGMLFPAEVSK